MLQAIRNGVKNKILGWPGALRSLAQTLQMWWTNRIQSQEVERPPQEGKTLEEIPVRTKNGDAPLQVIPDGRGWLYHRSYHIDIAAPRVRAEDLFRQILADPNRFSAVEWMKFEKIKGRPGAFEVGDEFQIYIRGPWNGPVRVVDVSPAAFSFATLEGHMEAGEIRFGFEFPPELPNGYRFRIQSWARSKNMLVELIYETVPLPKVMQSHAWAYFCKRVVEESGGRESGPIRIQTEKFEYQGEEKT